MGHTFLLTGGLGDHGIGFSGLIAPESLFSLAGVASTVDGRAGSVYRHSTVLQYSDLSLFVCTSRVELVSTCSLKASNSSRAGTILWVGVNSPEKPLSCSQVNRPLALMGACGVSMDPVSLSMFPNRRQ